MLIYRITNVLHYTTHADFLAAKPDFESYDNGLNLVGTGALSDIAVLTIFTANGLPSDGCTVSYGDNYTLRDALTVVHEHFCDATSPSYTTAHFVYSDGPSVVYLDIEIDQPSRALYARQLNGMHLQCTVQLIPRLPNGRFSIPRIQLANGSFFEPAVFARGPFELSDNTIEYEPGQARDTDEFRFHPSAGVLDYATLSEALTVFDDCATAHILSPSRAGNDLLLTIYYLA